MEKTNPQPDEPSDDLHAILNRFSSWTGRHSAGAAAKSLVGEGVREISCEEAMRLVRSRRAAQTHQPPLPPHFAAPPTPEAISQLASQAAAERPSQGVAVPGVDALASDQPKATRTPARARKRAVQTAPKSARQRKEKREPAAALEQKPDRGASAKASRNPSQRQPEFRDVILRTAAARDTTHPRKAKAPERTQRVSVRLSAAEESLLLQQAAKAGMTVSEYLRLRALPPAAPRPQSQPPAMAARVKDPVDPRPSRPSPQTAHGGLGDWLSLLRHRFLSAPARFAERA